MKRESRHLGSWAGVGRKGIWDTFIQETMNLQLIQAVLQDGMQLQTNGLGRASLLWSRPCTGCPNTCPNYVFLLLLVWPLVSRRLITLPWKLGVKRCPLNPDNSKGLAAWKPKNIELLRFTVKGIIQVRHNPLPVLVICTEQVWPVTCLRAIRVRGDINVGVWGDSHKQNHLTHTVSDK